MTCLVIQILTISECEGWNMLRGERLDCSIWGEQNETKQVSLRPQNDKTTQSGY